ncbi:MAG TPA: arginine--tRNA ligase [Gammaproteobacteria bacterium]|nr:arginine--tRNA ligase [Gammaproteobacteria bacterium]
MKKLLTDLIDAALKTLGIDATDKIHIEYTRDSQHGDFASNIAMTLAKLFKKNPRELAQQIIDALPPNKVVSKIELAGPGFINFYLTPEAFLDLLKAINTQKNKYGLSTIGKGRKIHVEFVSSNPTGPLHVGHGRGAAYGATLCDLLAAIGCEVHREYYVNDAGRQMDILAASIYLRYLELCGEKFEFPLNAYQGDYVIDIAKLIFDKHNKAYFHAIADIQKNTPENTEEKKEEYIDIIIENTKSSLGEKNFEIIFNTGLAIILADIKQDLAEFGVDYQNWFSEKKLWSSNDGEKAIKQLKDRNYIYEKDGAIWFKSTEFGDDKDRVVTRENGLHTYFASDIAYHKWKFDHYNEVINVLGADHHGYIPRLKAIIMALGYPVEKFHAPIVQFATLYRGKEKVPMSTRKGQFVTLRELREEVGKDAARYFYISRKADQHMDFDLELAKSKSNENPVFYIQYAHARICSVFRQLPEKKLDFNFKVGLENINLLSTEPEKNLLLMLTRYPEVIETAATQYDPHLVAHYLKDLAESFHAYYNACPFLIPEETLRHARLCLVDATRQILSNGLQLLSVSAPETM